MARHIADEERFGGRRAIVIGGSMTGLVTARVLADHFDEVPLVERDALLDNDELVDFSREVRWHQFGVEWYLGKVHLAAARDREVALHFLRAMHMVASPTRLLQPALIARVLAGGLAGAAPPPSPRAG